MSNHSHSTNLRVTGSTSNSTALRASACPGSACWHSCAWSPILVCSSDPNRWSMHGIRCAISCVALAKPAYPVSWPKKSARPAPTQRHAHLGNGRLRRVLGHIGKQLAAEMGETMPSTFRTYVNGHDHEQRGS